MLAGYVLYVLTCLTCLRVFVPLLLTCLLFFMCLTCPHLFTRLTCLQYITCLTCLHFLTCITCPHLFTCRACLSFLYFLNVSNLGRTLCVFTSFIKCGTTHNQLQQARIRARMRKNKFKNSLNNPKQLRAIVENYF